MFRFATIRSAIAIALVAGGLILTATSAHAQSPKPGVRQHALWLDPQVEYFGAGIYGIESGNGIVLVRPLRVYLDVLGGGPGTVEAGDVITQVNGWQIRSAADMSRVVSLSNGYLRMTIHDQRTGNLVPVRNYR
jgi:S1-C subfamily serine protease